jgi:hypothetical protein
MATSSDNFFQLIIDFKAAIDLANMYLLGTETDTFEMDGEVRSSVAKVLAEKLATHAAEFNAFMTNSNSSYTEFMNDSGTSFTNFMNQSDANVAGAITQVVADIDSKWAAIQALVDSSLVFETKAQLDAYVPTVNSNGQCPVAKVWNDVIIEYNQLYGWDSSSSQWVVSKYDLLSSYIDKTTEFTNRHNELSRKSTQTSATDDDSLSFSITDRNGNASWLSIDKLGGIPDFVLNLMMQKMGSTNHFSPFSELDLTLEQQQKINGATFFKTLTELTTSSISKDSLAVIFQDNNPSMNGLYEYTGNSWVRSNLDFYFRYQTTLRSLREQKQPLLTRASDDDLCFSITDRNGNASWLSVDKSGGIPEFVKGLIKSAIFSVGDVSFGISTAGDSITQGLTADESNWPQILSDELYLPVWNPAVGGESVSDISTRFGALRPSITIDGGVIPTDTTPVNITSITPSDGWRGLLGVETSSIGKFEGVLCSVPGYLTRSPMYGTWTFTRKQPMYWQPTPIPCPDGSKFVTQEAKKHLNDIWILWIGRNSPTTSLVMRELNRLVSMLGSNSKFLCLSLLNNSSEITGTNGYDNIISINSIIESTYPENYFDMRSYLIANGLKEAGIEATEQDLLDISNDVTPESLRSDNLHPNVLCHPVIGRKLADVIRTKGWV